MQRTLENCSLIKKCVKRGISKPTQYYNINKYEGMLEVNIVINYVKYAKLIDFA